MANNKGYREHEGGDQCDFCGAPRAEVAVLFAGQDGVNICNNCIENGYHILSEGGLLTRPVPVESINKDGKITPLKMADMLRPAQIKAMLDQYVIGQDDAKRYMSVAVYNP